MLDIPSTVTEELIKRHGFTNPERDLGLAESKTVFPVEERSLAAVSPTESGHDVVSVSGTHKAIVRTDTDHIVGIVSQSYQPLRNSEFFGTVEEALHTVIPDAMFEGVQVRDKIAGGGAWTQREYVLPAYAEELRNSQYSTQVGLRIVAWNSYDGSASAGLMTGLIDFICTNGMVVGRDIAREMRRHTTRLQPGDFLPGLRKNLDRIHDEMGRVRQMAQTPLNHDLALAFLEKHLSGQRAAEMWRQTQLEAELRGDTVQSLHAALNYYASHADDRFQVRNTDPAREARMLRGREDEVQRLMSTAEWQRLAAA